MDAHVRDGLVTGYESLIDSLTLPDPNDRHVLAVAIRAGADLIVTFNLKHFPEAALKPYGIEAQHPDEFLTFQFDLAPNILCKAAKRHRESLRERNVTIVTIQKLATALGCRLASLMPDAEEELR